MVRMTQYYLLFYMMKSFLSERYVNKTLTRGRRKEEEEEER